MKTTTNKLGKKIMIELQLLLRERRKKEKIRREDEQKMRINYFYQQELMYLTKEICDSLSDVSIKHLGKINQCSISLDKYRFTNGLIFVSYVIDSKDNTFVNDIGIEKMQEDINRYIAKYAQIMYQQMGDLACQLYPHLAKGLSLVLIKYDEPVYKLTFVTKQV